MDERFESSHATFLGGIVAIALRLFPWGAGGSVSLRLASFEDVVWAVGCALTTVGAMAKHRRLDVVAVVLSVMILGVGAVTQGKLGTAFRHPEQLLFELSILATLGAASVGGGSRRDTARGGGPWRLACRLAPERCLEARNR